MTFQRNSAVSRLLALAGVMGMLFSVPLAAKDKDYLEGKVLDSNKKSYSSMDRRSECHDGTSWSCDHVFMTLQVEDMTYVVDYEQHRGLSGIGDYKFKEEDWPVNGTVQLRFEVKHLLGLRRTFAWIKGPKGKEIRFVVYSKTGADGKEYCGTYRC